MDCEQLREHYEEYALGALEGPEREEIAAHLARRCVVCTPGVEDARWLVSQLAYAAPDKAPPAKLRRNLLANIRTRPEMRRSWVPALSWAAAAAALFFAVLTAQQVRELREQNAELQARSSQLSAELAKYQRAFTIAASPGTQSVSLVSAQPQTPQIRAYWNEPLGLLLLAQQMPVPAPDRTFQLWVVPRQGSPISADIFRPDASGQVLLISTPQATIAGAQALAITDEPAGGSPQPTTTPIWVGPIG